MSNLISEYCELSDQNVILETPVRLIGSCRIRHSVEINSFSTVNDDTTIYPHTSIGKYCSIGKRCEIGVSSHPTDWLSTSPEFYDIGTHFPDFEQQFHQEKYDSYKPTKIGHDVWIGSMCLISGGVSIGIGAIVAGGAVVTKDVAPYSIVGGVPAKEIRRRCERRSNTRPR